MNALHAAKAKEREERTGHVFVGRDGRHLFQHVEKGRRKMQARQSQHNKLIIYSEKGDTSKKYSAASEMDREGEEEGRDFLYACIGALAYGCLSCLSMGWRRQQQHQGSRRKEENMIVFGMSNKGLVSFLISVSPKLQTSSFAEVIGRGGWGGRRRARLPHAFHKEENEL